LDSSLREDEARAVCNLEVREGFPICKEEQQKRRIAVVMQVSRETGNWAKCATSSRKKQLDTLGEGVGLGSLDK